MKLAILFGGQSFEHEISIVSAVSLKKVLRETPVFIFLDAARDFYFIPPHVLTSKLFSSGEYKSYPKLVMKKGGWYQKGFFGENKIAFDVAVNLIHGGDGEDGKLASMLEFYAIPFVGPRLEACAISYNKWLTKCYAESLGFPVLPYALLHKDSPRRATLPFPLIIKPLRLGSSIGIGVVRSAEDLEYALDVAYEFDDTVLLEPFLEGVKEYNLAGCRAQGRMHTSIVEEPEKKEILDFDKKYLDFSRTERVRKAEIDSALQARLEEAFGKVYGTLFDGSLIRCDFFVQDQTLYLNEINPIPGSLAHYLFESYEPLLHALAQSLPRGRTIPIEYRYISQIQAAKGK